jgi:transposase
MSKAFRAQYTLDHKQEAVRLVRSGQPIGAVARGLGILDQTAHNWVKAEAEGRLAASTIKAFTAEQTVIARLKAELARVRMERVILKKASAYFAKESPLDTSLSSDIGTSGRSTRNAACCTSASAAMGNIGRAKGGLP